MDNFEQNYYNPENPFSDEKKRPALLTTLCILTFIGSGISALAYLILTIFNIDFATLGQMYGSFPGVQETYDAIAEVSQWKFFILALVYIASFAGAVFMFKMKKAGFHLYTCAQLALLIVLYFLLGGVFKPGMSSYFLVVLFVGLYALNYKELE